MANCSQVSLVEACNEGLVNSYRTHRNDDPSDLVSLAEQIQKAGEFIQGHTSNQLLQIMEQITQLQEQARAVLDDASHNATLHQYACNLVKKVGTVYHFYERPSGQRYLSLLSPAEWGVSAPHSHVGSYRLEPDQSWTPLAQIKLRDQKKAVVARFVSRAAITDVTFNG